MNKLEKVPLMFGEVKTIAYSHLLFDIWNERAITAKHTIDKNNECGYIELKNFPLSESKALNLEWCLFWDGGSLRVFGINAKGEHVFQGQVFLSPDKVNVDNVLKCLG